MSEAAEPWRVQVAPSALRSLERLPPRVVGAVVEFVTRTLPTNPERMSKPLRYELEGLRSAHGVLQAQVARELGTRRTPVLAFEYDPAIERGVRLTQMIDELSPPEPDVDSE